MWPKMLLEMLPHLGRLMPMAEKYFASRGAGEKEQEAALQRLSDSLRGKLGQVAETHGGIQRALQEQGAQVAEIAVEATRVRLGVESVELRVVKLEKTASVAIWMLGAAMAMLAAALVLLGAVLVHLRR